MALDRRDNQRVIRAPRGTALSAGSWQTEAPLRMLMNNLDAEVAESPEELVVYGGIGRAARDWRCFDVLVETLKKLGDDETLCVQSGKPVGVFRTHPDAPRVLIANSNLVAHWASWDKFHELDRIGPHDVRPDDRGVMDLHRQPGDHPGHLRDLRRGGPPALRRRSVGPVDPDRRARRHGRRPAARRDDGRGVAARGGVPRGPDRAAPRRPAISTRWPPTSTRLWRSSRRPAPRGDRCQSACLATPPRSTPSWCAAACVRTS